MCGGGAPENRAFFNCYNLIFTIRAALARAEIGNPRIASEGNQRRLAGLLYAPIMTPAITARIAMAEGGVRLISDAAHPIAAEVKTGPKILQTNAIPRNRPTLGV